MLMKNNKYDINYVKELWEEFGDTPVEFDTDNIAEPWRQFEKGTDRFEIWHWFEDTFGVPVVDLLYGEVIE